MAQEATRDGLLATLRMFVKFIRGLSIIGMLLLGGIAAIFALVPPSALKDVGENMTKLHALSLSAMLVLAISLLVMLYKALGKLLAIVATVDDGDPFVPENADRLEEMGWLAVYAIPVMIVIVGIGLWLQSVVTGIEIDVHVDLGLLLLALILFVLARVFRIGSEMRKDLEGTV